MADLTTYTLLEHPAKLWFDAVSDKLSSLTDEAGNVLFSTVEALHTLPKNPFGINNVNAALLSFGEEAFSVSTSVQFDENFWYGYMYLFFIVSIPTDQFSEFDLRMKQMNLHYTVMLNLRDAEVPLNDDNVTNPTGLMPLYSTNNSAIAFFGGMDRAIEHRYNVALKTFGFDEQVMADYYVSSIKLPFYCDMRRGIA